MNQILLRLNIFWRQLVVLWYAFWHPATPFYLKAMMVGIVAYVISPFDLLPDFIVGLGLVDDILLVAIAMNWIVGKLPREVFFKKNDATGSNSNSPDPFGQSNNTDDEQSIVIDGNSRRL